MEELTETQKQVAALILVCGLFFVFVKAIYERFTQERFTFFNLFHPIKPISAKERHFITSFLVPFQKFNPQQRRRFLKRFAWFKSKKSFVFYGDIQNKEEIKAYVAASAILTTLGLRNFQFQKSISRIVVYPSKYYSNVNKRAHLGEYNPRLKTLVFSAEDLKHGFKIPNDGLNLGIHEIAHALLFEKHQKSSWEAKKFKIGLIRLKAIFEARSFNSRIDNSSALRAYAKTSFMEFFAVAVESFFEDPKALEKEFPKVYFYLNKMLNLILLH